MRFTFDLFLGLLSNIEVVFPYWFYSLFSFFCRLWAVLATRKTPPLYFQSRWTWSPILLVAMGPPLAKSNRRDCLPPAAPQSHCHPNHISSSSSGRAHNNHQYHCKKHLLFPASKWWYRTRKTDTRTFSVGKPTFSSIFLFFFPAEESGRLHRNLSPKPL